MTYMIQTIVKNYEAELKARYPWARGEYGEALKIAATAARAAWLERAARVGRTVEAPTAITFAFEGGSYRAEWRKRGLQIVQIAHCARSVKWGTRPERRVV